MSANVEAMVREGIRAYRAGNKTEARALLLKAVELDQYNEEAWLWLSATVDDPEEQRTCLENVLVINPNNDRAKKGLEMLGSKAPPSSPPSPSTSGAPLTSGPFGAADADELPTSLEWDMPATETSSASSTVRPKEPTKQEYDDWVSNLNLGTGAAPPESAPPSFGMTPFTDEDEEFFDQMDEEPALPPPPPQSPARPSAPPLAAARPPVMSPAPKAPPPMSPGFDDADDLLAEIEETDFDDEDDVFAGDGDDPSAYFDLIPMGIKPTRLPGEDEKYPSLVPVGFVVLVILNLIAAGLVVFNFFMKMAT